MQQIVWNARASEDRDLPLERTDSAKKPPTLPELPQPSKNEKIDRALKWVESNLSNVKEDDMWFQRLAETYWVLSKDSEAIRCFEIGKTMSSTNWKLFTGCASAYASLGRLDRAIEEANTGLNMIRNKPDVDLLTEPSYLFNVQRLVEWYMDAGRWSEAISEAQAALQVAPTKFAIFFLLLEATRMSGVLPRDENYITIAFAEPSEDGKANKLMDLIRHATNIWIEEQDYTGLERILMFARTTDVIPTVTQALQQLSESEKVQDNVRLYSTFRLWECTLLAFISPEQNQGNLELAIKTAEEVLAMPENIELRADRDEATILTCKQFYKILSTTYTRLLIASVKEGSVEHCARMVERMEEIMKASSTDFTNNPPGLTGLVAYYALLGQKDKARDLLRPRFQEYLDMLSDDTPTNDVEGFFLVARMLVFYGDDQNALTAWSLLCPFDADVGLDSTHWISESEFRQRYLPEAVTNVDDLIRSVSPVGGESDVSVSDYGSDNDSGIEDDDEKSLTSEKSEGQDPIPDSLEATRHILPSNPTTTDGQIEKPALSKIQTASDVPDHIFKETAEASDSGSMDANEATVLHKQIPADIRQRHDAEEDDTVAIDSRPTILRVHRSHMSPTTLNGEEVRWIFDPVSLSYLPTIHNIY